MSEAFSSENAEEKGNDEYESLEEYIFQTDRDTEREIGKPIRLQKWQERQLRIIKSKIGTNAVEVVARSYLMGLSRLREGNKENVDELNELLTKFLIVVGQDPRNTREIDAIDERVMGHEASIDEPSDSTLTDPYRFKLRESAVSEVENSYVQDAFFGAWIHRYVASLGFLDSEFITPDAENRLTSMSASIEKSVGDTRGEVEEMITQFLGSCVVYWAQEGVNKETYDHWVDMCEMLSDDKEEACMEILDKVEVYVDD